MLIKRLNRAAGPNQKVPLRDVIGVIGPLLGQRWGALLKIAMTDLVAPRKTVQSNPETLSHPLHLRKSSSTSGVAVRVTFVPQE